MQYVSIFMDVFSFFSILFLLYNSIRSSRFKCEIDGTMLDVPADEIKNAFRRSALAEASARFGGRRIEFEKITWKGNLLSIKTKKT